jgi:hypothetical protein
LKSGDVAQLLSRGMEDEFVDVRLAAVKAVQGVLEGDEIGDEGREEVGSDLVGKACHVSGSWAGGRRLPTTWGKEK